MVGVLGGRGRIEGRAGRGTWSGKGGGKFKYNSFPSPFALALNYQHPLPVTKSWRCPCP